MSRLNQRDQSRRALLQRNQRTAPPLSVLDESILPWVERRGPDECRRAVASAGGEDAFNGPLILRWLAMSAAWVDEKISPANSSPTPFAIPGSLSDGQPSYRRFGSATGRPRFEKIVNSLAPR